MDVTWVKPDALCWVINPNKEDDGDAFLEAVVQEV